MRRGLSRKERTLIFAAFALALGVVIAHETNLPQYCLRLLTPTASSPAPRR